MTKIRSIRLHETRNLEGVRIFEWIIYFGLKTNNCSERFSETRHWSEDCDRCLQFLFSI